MAGRTTQAANSDNDTGLRVMNLPPNLIGAGGLPVHHRDLHAGITLITPFDRFGIQVPDTLYSIAYF